MGGRRRILSASLILILSLSLVLQPAPSGPLTGWHLRWPKIHLPFDASSPFRAVASVFVDTGRLLEGAAGYVATAMDAGVRGIGSLFLGGPAKASTPADQELTANRTQTSDSYQRPDGSRYALISADAVNYKDSQGNWQPIDPTLVADPSGWHNTADDFAVHFSSDSTSPALVKITWKNSVVSFGLVGGQAVTPTVTGAIITYPGILPNTDLSFAMTPRGIIKTLRLKTRPSSPPVLKFHVDLVGLSPQAASRAVNFLASDGSGWTMLPVWMFDSAGVVGPDNAASSNVVLSWGSDTAGGYLLTVTPNNAWLTDPARVYPVTIDPTVTLNPGAGFQSGLDTFVQSSAGYADSAQWRNVDLKTGYYYNSSSDNAKARGLMKFDFTGLAARTCSRRTSTSTNTTRAVAPPCRSTSIG